MAENQQTVRFEQLAVLDLRLTRLRQCLKGINSSSQARS